MKHHGPVLPQGRKTGCRFLGISASYSCSGCERNHDAGCYVGGNPLQVAVRDIAKPIIQLATDVIVQVTTSAICGTDLHIYHGILGGTNVPYSIGHEAIGVITEIGSAVQKFKVGDRVIIPTDPNPDELLVGPQLGPVTYTNYGFGNFTGDLGGTQGSCSPLLPSPVDALIARQYY